MAAGCSETPLQRPDEDFDVSVESPAFIKKHPVVLFDEGHNNFHTSSGLYHPFVSLIRNDGYLIKVLGSQISEEDFTDVNILVIANAKGEGDANDAPAFSAIECKMIRNWVNNGGSLLLIADHFPFGSAAQTLADEFGIEFQKGMVEDSMNYDTASTDYSQLVFSKENGLLAEHPITKKVNKVITFTGQSIKCKDSCFSFMNLSSSAYDLSPEVNVSKDGNDTRVAVNYIHPASAKGRSQGIAMNVGKGKVVVLGEAAMLTAQLTRDDKPVGMNYNADNKKLALNIVHWLAD